MHYDIIKTLLRWVLLFFRDIIEIFEISSKDVLKDKKINYSDKQHAGNKGEGQFHINNQTYHYHKNKYFVENITYENLIKECVKIKQLKDISKS